MLLNLGDISLDQVSNHVATRALLGYTPPVKEAEVRAEYRKVRARQRAYGFQLQEPSAGNRLEHVSVAIDLLTYLTF